MSKTNCLLPSKGFCLNFLVRMVNSTMADGGAPERIGTEPACEAALPCSLALEP